MTRYDEAVVFKFLNPVCTPDELTWLKSNYSFFSSEGDVYPLLGKTAATNLDLSTFLSVAERKSPQFLRKVSGALRPLVNSETDILLRHFFHQTEITLFYRHREEGFLDDAIMACHAQIALSKTAGEEFRSGTALRLERITKQEEFIQTFQNLISGEDEVADRLMQRTIDECKSKIEELRNAPPPSLEGYRGPIHVGFKQLCIILEKQGRIKDALEYACQARDHFWGGDWDARIAKLEKKLLKNSPAK